MTIPTGADRPFFKAAKNNPEVIAHRGGKGEWPEETIYALERAQKIVDIFEIDVHMTRDGHLVLMHDDNTERTTGVKRSIKESGVEDITSLNAAVKWPSLISAPDVNVPRLEEVFGRFPGMRMNIEIKQKDPTIVPELCRLIKEYDMTDKVLVASGWNGVLREFRKHYPEVATSASILEIAEFKALDNIFDWDYRPEADALQWTAKLIVPLITRKFVSKAHALNLKVHAWTVNKSEEMERMIELGVDGIITDYPSRLCEILGRPVNT